MRLLDEWLPEYDVVERHDVAMPVPPERALDVALASPAAPDRTVAALLGARGMPARARSSSEGTTSGTSAGRRPNGPPRSTGPA